MAGREAYTEELVVGLYDMGEIGFVQPPAPDVQVANPDYPEEAFKRLKSGRMSPHYVNGRNLASLSGSLPISIEQQVRIRSLAIDSLAEVIEESEQGLRPADHLVGLPQAMTTLAGMVALRMGRSAIWLRVPEEGKKTYGAHDAVQGHFAPGETIEGLDNVITDGASKFEVVKPLEEVGLQVRSFTAFVDREEGGREAVEGAGYGFSAVVGMRAITNILAEAGRITPEQRAWAEEYRERHFPTAA